MRILVTGSEGRLGSAVVPLLRSEGHTVVTTDRSARPVEDGEVHIAGDLRDVFVARNAVLGMDVVVHLAGLTNDRSPAHEVEAINVTGAWNVAAACQEAGITRIVYASSINATGTVGGRMGQAQYLPIDDDYPCHPKPGYQLSKYLSDEVLRSYSYAYEMTTISLRFALLTARPGESRRHWNVLQHPPERKVRMGVQMYWGYVDTVDAARAVAAACVAEITGHHEFLIYADDTMVDVPTAQLIKEFYPDTTWHVDMDTWLAENPNASLFDTSRAKAILGWQPQVSWREYEYESMGRRDSQR